MAEEDEAQGVADEPQMVAPADIQPVLDAGAEAVEGREPASTSPSPPSDPLADLDDDALSSHTKVAALIARERADAEERAQQSTAREISNMARKHLLEGGFAGDVARAAKAAVDAGEEFNPATLGRSIETAWKGLWDHVIGNVDEFIDQFIPEDYAVPKSRERDMRAAAAKAGQGDMAAANKLYGLRVQTLIDATRADERVKLRAELEPELRKEIEAELKLDAARTEDAAERQRPRQTAGVSGRAPGNGVATYSNLSEARRLHAQGKLSNEKMRELKFKAERGQFPGG